MHSWGVVSHGLTFVTFGGLSIAVPLLLFVYFVPLLCLPRRFFFLGEFALSGGWRF
jgi:hypothetical protein